MKKFIIFLIFILLPLQSLAAIAFDAVGAGNATATSVTFAHTVTGSNTILFVGVYSSGGDFVTGVTYAGTAMAQQNKVNDPNGNTDYIYMLVNPTTGTNNVVITRSDIDALCGRSVSYTGAAQTGQPDAKNTGNSGATTAGITVNVTTVADNSWGVMFGNNNQASIDSSSTNFTRRSAAFSIAIGDTNAPKTPAGSLSMTMTNGGTSAVWAANMITFAPVAAPPSGFVKPPDIINF